MKQPPIQTQRKAYAQVIDAKKQYENLTNERRSQLVEVYRTWANFKLDQTEDWQVGFKINKAHEVVEKWLPRLMGQNPRWIVSPNKIQNFPDTPAITQLTEATEFVEGEEKVEIENKVLDERKGNANEQSKAIQDYLSYVFEEYNLIENVRLWAKNMIVTGKGYAKVGYKWETYKTEIGGEEEVVGEHPTIDVVSFTDMYYDPRYIFMKDRPAVVETTEGVRMGDLWNKKEQYFNLDKLEKIGSIEQDTDMDTYKQQVRTICGITPNGDKKIALNSLTLDTYYGYFTTTTAKDEKMYKITVASNTVVIQFEEITCLPHVEIKCFEDTESGYAHGVVEPIVSLQEELNYKKNAASEYINKGLTRQLLLSTDSGIDPANINDPVVITTKTIAEEQQRGFMELPHRDINPSYFQEENDFERQIQGMTFTVDTANPRSQQAMTNTATGARIKFFESNSVIGEVRKHLEAGMQEIAYKMLQSTFENMEDNIVFKKQGTEEYWMMNKEMLRGAVRKFSIRIEVNSSSVDYLEDRREEAIAWFNILAQAQQMGVNVDMTEAIKDIGETFEKKDINKYIKPPAPQQVAQGMGMIPQPEQGQDPAAALTESVAKGGITSAM